MNTVIRRMLALTAVAVFAAPAMGQSLADRINAVRRERAEAEARARQAADNEASTQLRMLQELFYRELTVNFDQTPARDVFEYLDNALELKLTVRYSDDAAGHGIDPETEITLDAADMPAIELLDQVLDQCSVHEPCTWQLRKSFLEVGTKERLGAPAAQYVRMYPIDDLLFEPPKFEDAKAIDLNSVYERGYGGFGRNAYGGGPGLGFGGAITPAPSGNVSETKAQELVDLIIMTVEPDAWTNLGGTWASIRHYDGTLIVRAPEFVHRQLGGYPRIPRPAWASQPRRPTDAPASGAATGGG